jgi:hypothetical protein
MRFEGTIDPSTQTIEIRSVEANDGTTARGLSVVPVVQDGTPGSGPDNTLELVTTNTGQGVAVCGRANSFCGDVTVRSFFRTQHLQNVWVEILTMSPATGFNAYNSSSNPPAGLTTTNGVWSYGTLASFSSNATVNWGLNLPSQQRFTFTGDIQANVVGTGMGPTIAVNPTSAAAGASVTVTGSNFMANEAVTIFLDAGGTMLGTATADGTGAFTQPVTLPSTSPPSTRGAHLIDASGNAGSDATATFTINAWTQVAAVTGTPVSVAVSPNTNATPFEIYVGTSGSGVFHSTDGVSWASSGPASVLAVSSFPMQLVTWASLANGTAQMTGNGGTTWTMSTLPPPGVINAWSAVAMAGPFGATSNGASGRVVNGRMSGASWSSSQNLGTGVTRGVAAIAGTPVTVYAAVSGAAGGVFRMTFTAPATWSAPTNISPAGITDALAIAFALSSPTTLYLGTNGQGAGVFVTTNGGTSWTSGTGLGSTTVNAIAIDPTNANHAYAATAAGVYVTNDGGNTWSLSGLSSGAVTSVAVLNGAPLTVYATNPSGLFVTTTGGL